METQAEKTTRSTGIAPAVIRWGMAAAVLVAAAVTGPEHAAGQGVVLEFDTELLSMNLTGGPFPMPVATDPGNSLGDSIDGYGLVDCRVTITLSSQRPVDPGPMSHGQACAFNHGNSSSRVGEGCFGSDQPIDPLELDGQPFFVNSFFDVFFDITLTDVDPRPGRNIGGFPDGASIVFTDNGPAGMQSNWSVPFDMDAPNYGLVPPPEVSPYIGHFLIEIPLGVDINDNGELDKVKFQLATHSVGDANRTFVTLPDGTILDTFDSAAFLEGAIVDQSSDPPFSIGAIDPLTGLPDPSVFGGPTTASGHLLTPVRIDHFLFYGIKPSKGEAKPPKFGPVVLSDQFGNGRYVVANPAALGLPADKNGEGFAGPLGANGTHLERYPIKLAKGESKFAQRRVRIVNQCSDLAVEVQRPESLLVPSNKRLDAPPSQTPAEPSPDHMLCYRVKALDFPKGTQVVVTDQFDNPQRRYDLKKVTKLCNPVDKSGNPQILSGPNKGDPFPIVPAAIRNPEVHLVCYQARLAKKAIPQTGCGATDPTDKGIGISPAQTRHGKVLGFFVNNQFGPQKVDSVREQELCVPSQKILLP